MQIRAQVKSNQRIDKISWAGDKLLISVTAPAIEGRANERVLELVSSKLGIAKSLVGIEKGSTSPYKKLRIDMADEDLIKRLNRLEQSPLQLDLL